MTWTVTILPLRDFTLPSHCKLDTQSFGILSTLRDNLSIRSYRVKHCKNLDCLILEDGTDRLSRNVRINYNSALANIPKDSRPQVYLYHKDTWPLRTLVEGRCIAGQIKHPPFARTLRTTFSFLFGTVKTNVIPKQIVPNWARTPYFQRICQNSTRRMQDVGISHFIARLNVEKVFIYFLFIYFISIYPI